MNEAQAIGLYQPLLQTIAIKMVGSMEDAEDIVQDTFLKWLSTDRSEIKNTKSYLIKAVTNNCLQHLNALKKKKDDFIANLPTDILVEKGKEAETFRFDFEAELTEALAIVHKRLEPMEKAVFVLREIFDFEYEDLQELFDQKKENCRQMLCRARQKLQQEPRKIKVDPQWHKTFADNFRMASTKGKFSDFIQDLHKEIDQRFGRKPAQ